jgi:mannosyltransferase OCH1-like enzyme
MKKSYAFNQRQYDSFPNWAILDRLYDRNFINADKSKSSIPKKIHQIWLGSPFPDKYKKWANTWRDMNPDWEYRLWTEGDLDELNIINRSLYASMSNYGPKSDFLRYHILNQFGGLYVDTDFECLKPFDELSYAEFITGIGYPMKPELYVGLIGSIPHHPITEYLVSEISKRNHDMTQAEVLKVISSYFFTRCFFDVIKGYMPGVVALPPNYFYPFPNNRGFEKRDGKKFILPESYAVHYWEISWATKSGNIDWIQGERFWKIADSIYSPNIKHRDDYSKLENTFDPFNLKDVNIVYTHTFYVNQLFNILRHLSGEFIVITHNSDINVDDSFEIPDNVIKWYTQNVNTPNPKVQSIPIGIPNTMWDKGLVNRTDMVERLKKDRKFRNLLYVNHNNKTNYIRPIIATLFSDKSWVTVEKRVPFKTYIDQVYNHKFVACPDGNGIDTHRLWETLYMGSIPIVLSDLNNRFYDDLPICFVDSWSRITEDFLNKEFERIKLRNWNYGKMNFEYWRNLITKL